VRLHVGAGSDPDADYHELKSAFDWLNSKAGEHGIQGPIIVTGWSAGGHLTSFTLDHPKVAAGLAISGVHNLPEAVLGAVVIYAVARMMKVHELKRFYQFHVDEFAQAMLALFGVIVVGILPGLAIAIVLSLLRFIWGASYLSISRLRPVLGKEHTYGNIEHPAGRSPIQGLEILRLNGPLFFANALRFRNEVRSLLSGSNPLKAILINLHANFGIDLSSTDVLLGLVAEAKKTNTEVLFAELQDPVRQMFRRSGLLDRVGEDRLFSTVDDGVQDYLARHPEVSRVGV
jgi:SulP family sulfate permease